MRHYALLIFLLASLPPMRARAADSHPCDPSEDGARITVHLRRVESILRARDTSTLSPAQRAARKRNLDRLNAYVKRGQYPKNDDYPGERVPYFVDDQGVLCAVAHLVRESGHPDLVAAVVERFNNARVREIKSRALVAWAESEGFSVDELALIQPSYCGSACQSFNPCVTSFCSPNDPNAPNNACIDEVVPDHSPCRGYDGREAEDDPCRERVCMGGVCVDGRPRDCDDGDPSTVDSCESGIGCVNAPEEEEEEEEKADDGDDGSCALTRTSSASAVTALMPIAALLFAARRRKR